MTHLHSPFFAKGLLVGEDLLVMRSNVDVIVDLAISNFREAIN